MRQRDNAPLRYPSPPHRCLIIALAYLLSEANNSPVIAP